MKSIALAAVTTLGLIATTLVVANAPANAVGPTTIAGPDQVGYYANVTITGTAAPNSHVAVYFRVTGRGSYAVDRNPIADANGRWSTSYYASSDDQYYAVAEGVASPVHRTALVTATCTTSGPAFTKLPVTPFTPDDPHYAAFTATRNGAWAGIAYAQSPYADFAVIAWRPGHPLVVLDRIRYTKVRGYARGLIAPIEVVGITPDSAVVASVLRDVPTPDVSAGVVWSGGHQYTLSHASNWISFAPVGVSDKGVIAGWAQVGSGSSARYFVVKWAGPTAGFTVVAAVGKYRPVVAVDAAGDIGVRDGVADSIAYLRSGGTATLSKQTDGDFADPLVGAGPYLYGLSFGVARWNAGRPVGGTIPAEPLGPIGDYVTAGGPRGDVIANQDLPRHLRTANGAYLTMPTEYTANRMMDPPPEAIDSSGRVAFTSAVDGLPHFLTCRPVTAQNDGRPVAGSAAADVDGDGRADLLATKPDGSLWYYRNTGSTASPFGAGSKIGASGWTVFTKLAAADIDGNRRADLLAVKRDGSLWLYLDTGNATRPYSSGSKIGASGWNGFDKVAAADVNGDGRADIIATRPDGSLWLYPNTGNATRPYSSGTRLGASGWNGFDKLIAGDADGDGRADLLVTRPFGTLSQYINNHSPTAPFAGQTQVGSTGWQGFDRIL